MTHVCGGKRVSTDDTPLPILEPGRGRTRTGRLWAYARDDRSIGGTAAPALVFHATPDRTAAWPARHLVGYCGILQVDGYAGFDQLTQGGHVHLAACWAHTRRKFYELHRTGAPIATETLARTRELYEIEEQIRDVPPDQRMSARQEHSRPRVIALHSWLVQKLTLLPSRSKLTEAIRYALNRWQDLARFVDDGRIDLDTNLVEQGIRPVAVGRKNALFAGRGRCRSLGDRGLADQDRKLNGIEPLAWLRDALVRMVAGYPVAVISHLQPIADSLHV